MSIIGRDPLKNHKATKPAFIFGPPSAPSETPLKWRFADGQFIVIFGSSIPTSTKKNKNKKKTRYRFWTPSDKTFWIRAKVTISNVFFLYILP